MVLFALPSAGMAQVPDYIAKGAELAGAMHAAGRVCQDYSDEQLRDMKQQQKSHAAAAGVSDARFEAIFQVSYDTARARMAQMTPAQKEKACQDLRAVARMTAPGAP